MKVDPRCFDLRAIIIATVPGVEEDKNRRSVVLRVDGQYLEIAYGQSKPSATPSRDIVVKMGSSYAKRYCITRDTYFRPGNIEIIHRSAVQEFKGVAPTEHLLAMQEFAKNKSLERAPVLVVTPRPEAEESNSKNADPQHAVPAEKTSLQDVQSAPRHSTAIEEDAN